MPPPDGVASDAAPARTLWWDGGDVVEVADLFAEETDLELIASEVVARLGVSGDVLPPDIEVQDSLTAVTVDEAGDVVTDLTWQSRS